MTGGFYGCFAQYLGCSWLLSIAFIGLIALLVGYFGVPLIGWAIATFLVLVGFGAPIWLIFIVGLCFVPFLIPFVRTNFISKNIMIFMQKMKIMPVISETEKIALEAGSTWMDGELFSGKPNIDTLLSQKYEKLSGEEKDFIDNKVTKLCELASDWDIFQNQDLPKEVWDYLKKEKFFGMIVPKEYGGLGFSALANSAVIQKTGSHSVPLSICVMVPNSLGPAELLAHYGTEKQKDYYLPRLADGREIPCFALTEPKAGSDAGAIESSGVVFKDKDGALKIRLNWNKRYITLAAISTLIGLAIKLRDPENLLGKGEDLGITCVLVPADTKGVVLGKRHNPMGVPFYNCPLQGHDVVVSIDQIIGGEGGVGLGWMMLMECLAIGRSIALPAQNTGGSKRAFRTTSAYSNIRKQFGVEIGKFEGIQEPLARMGGMTYILEAMRTYTCGAVDSGKKPAVVSAIAKYMSTELGRKIINDTMDIQGGAGISRGPLNTASNWYIATPIGITVEGANILTRTMIIFGQGAIRCHPYAYTEVNAVNNSDEKAFDRAFFGHVGFIIRNLCRTVLLNLTRAIFVPTPGPKVTKRYLQKLSWCSANFAILADLAMAAFGGELKMREKITGRFADVLSWMYVISAVARKFKADGSKPEDEAFVHWAMQYSYAEIDKAYQGIYANFDKFPLNIIFKFVGFWTQVNPYGSMPSDAIDQKICQLMGTDSIRESLSEGIHIDAAVARLDETFDKLMATKPILKKIRKASKAGKIARGKPHRLVEEAVEKGVITAEEQQTLADAEAARDEA